MVLYLGIMLAGQTQHIHVERRHLFIVHSSVPSHGCAMNWLARTASSSSCSVF